MKIRKYILQPWPIALFIAIVVSWVFLGGLVNKYNIEIIEDVPLEEKYDQLAYFNDLDNDGISEKILSFQSHENKHSIQIWSNDGGIIAQENFNGLPPLDSERIGFGDYDQDGYCELYVFCQLSDTVTLNAFEPFDEINPLQIKNFNITGLTRKYAEPEFRIRDINFIDITSDKYPDMVFTISSGFSLIPRKIYCFDIFNKKLNSTPEFGNIISPVSICDIDNDGNYEIIGGTSAAENVKPDLGIPFHDYSAWIMAFNHELQLLFDPIEYPGFRSRAQVLPLKNQKKIVAFYNHIGPLDNYPKLLLLDGAGEIVDSFAFPLTPKFEQNLFVTGPDDEPTLNIFDQKGKIQQFDLNFNKIGKTDLKTDVHTGVIQQADLDGNGSKENIFLSTNPKGILITDENLKNPAFIEIESGTDLSTLSGIAVHGAGNHFFVMGAARYFIFSYQKNLYYPFRFLLYLAVFVGIYLFILAIRKLQLIQIERQNRLRYQIANLQLKNIKNQMDPHFTFNVFNTIASIIAKESETAYKPFLQFSKLVRNTLESSDKISRPISDEISYLENFLDLEKLRFPGLFEYKIVVEDEVDRAMKVPKMILQTYVENALKHGIRPKNENGIIEIRFANSGKYLQVSVSDNGIGRAKAKELNTGTTGFGLKIMEDYFQLFNEYNESKIHHKILDQYNESGKVTGTKVIVFIPLDFSYKLRKYGKTTPNGRDRRR